MAIEAVLFDLDGTLADTAPDLIEALNHLRRQNSLTDVSVADFRQWVSFGATALLREGMGIDTWHPDYPLWKEKYLAKYMQCLAEHTTLFDGVLSVLSWLEQEQIVWGIVTNKPQLFTHALLPHLPFVTKPQVVICGDTLDEAKPSAKPILHAIKLLGIASQNSLFVGDSYNDIEAGHRANMPTVFAQYGYLNPQEQAQPNPYHADYIISQPIDIIKVIKKINSI